jgi:hypothetical protein
MPAEKSRLEDHPDVESPSTFHRRARSILTSFLATFVAARLTVFLIAFRHIPDLNVYLDGIHVHHLNFGILLLSVVGGYLLLGKPAERGMHRATAFYGVGLALTFDEFGMWLHLGGSYWQRASFDAVVIITAFLGLTVMAPHFSRFRPHRWATAAALLLVLLVAGVVFADSVSYAHRMLFHIETLQDDLSK